MLSSTKALVWVSSHRTFLVGVLYAVTMLVVLMFVSRL